MKLGGGTMGFIGENLRKAKKLKFFIKKFTLTSLFFIMGF
jgi:hypothetical protein